jgi:hypothetical protein
MTTIEKKLIQAGVKNLREFGYPDCNETNILKDEIYSAFFKRMLEDNKGHGVDKDIDALLKFLENVQALAPLGRGWASKRDSRLKLRGVWPTEQPQRLSSRALFALFMSVIICSAIMGKTTA